MDEALAEYGSELFVYGPVQGSLLLREALVAWMARGGIRTSAEQAVVLHGSQQGLDLIARVLLEPGDAVVVESPTYLGALHVFRGAGARLLPVALDQRWHADGPARTNPRTPPAEVHLHPADLPEPDRRDDVPRAAARAPHARGAVRRADRRGRYIQRTFLRR